MLRSLRVSLLLFALLSAAASCGSRQAPPILAPKDRARELYEEGRARAEAGRWAEARDKHAEAFQLFPHWQIAGALGLAELHTKEHRDAAEHIALFLEQAPAEEVTVAERKEMADHLATARARVGVLILAVADGAEIQIDGQLVGTTPLKRPLFVKPGRHTVDGALGGRRSTSTVLAMAGAKHTIRLDLTAKQGSGQPPR